MSSEATVIAFHWMMATAIVIYSWSRSRSIFHPHFLFSIMQVIFFSDFLLRGYGDQNIETMPRLDLYKYQADICGIILILVYLTAQIRIQSVEKSARAQGRNLEATPRVQRAIFILATSIVCAELAKIGRSVGWSFDQMIFEMAGPRGQRTWDIDAMSGNFVFAIITTVLPLASLSFAYLSVTAKAGLRISAIIGLIVILALLVSNGSRTPVVMTIVALGTFATMRARHRTTRVAVVIILSVVAFSLASLMYNFRSEGYQDVALQNSDSSLTTYQQDDSYYRALYAYYYSHETNERWDPYVFFGTVAVNPIPRAVWPDKPLLDASFYGGYKLEYVTTLYIGEIVAMSGEAYSIIFSVLFGITIYLVMYNAARLMPVPLGLGVYMIVVLYAYMCMRSMANLTLFAYLPVAALLTATILKRLSQARGGGLRARGPSR